MELKKHLSAENYKEKKNKYYLEPVGIVTTKDGLYYHWAKAGVKVFKAFLAFNAFLLFTNLCASGINVSFLIKTILGIIVCGVLMIISYKRELYFKNRDTSNQKNEARRSWLISNGIQADGKIVFILKKIIVISSQRESGGTTDRKIMEYFFDVEYYDKEEHGVRTITSVAYCNDIREVFASDKVKIYFNPNDKKDYIIEDIKLRQSDSDPVCRIPTDSCRVESTDNYLTDKIKYFNTNKTDDYT
jgi:hypothetical protein